MACIGRALEWGSTWWCGVGGIDKNVGSISCSSSR